MQADPFTELLISPHDSGIVVVSPAPISGGHMQLVSPEYAHPVRAELGMPLDTHLVILSIKDLPHWQGYTCELIGAQEQYRFVGNHAEPVSPQEAPRFTFRVAVCDAPLTLIAWRRQVYCQGTPSYLEVLWHPEMGETIAIKELEWGTTQESLKRLHRGLKLLKAIEAVGGRPPDMEEESFQQTYDGAYQKVLDAKRRDGNRLPTKREVADEMLMHRRTLARNLARFHLPWPPLRSR